MDHLTDAQNYKLQNGVWGLVFVGMLIPFILLRGLAIKLCWGWFLVPAGLPIIGLGWAIGLGIFLPFLIATTKTQVKRNKDEIDMKNTVTQTFLQPIIVIILGFLFSFFV